MLKNTLIRDIKYYIKNRKDYLKYGLLNEYGLNLDRINNYYKEENIIKRKCNIKKNSGK